MKILIYIVFIFLFSCTKSQPGIVIDGWWNIDYAKQYCKDAKRQLDMDKEMIKRFGCSAITGCNDFRKIADACAFDESGGVVQFENALMTEFASNPQCKSIEISYFSGPENDPKSKASKMLNDNHYSFSLDYTPGELKQRWKMTGPKNLNSYTEGEGNVLEIASKTCSIVNNSGAKLVN